MGQGCRKHRRVHFQNDLDDAKPPSKDAAVIFLVASEKSKLSPGPSSAKPAPSAPRLRRKRFRTRRRAYIVKTPEGKNQHPIVVKPNECQVSFQDTDHRQPVCRVTTPIAGSSRRVLLSSVSTKDSIPTPCEIIVFRKKLPSDKVMSIIDDIPEPKRIFVVSKEVDRAPGHGIMAKNICDSKVQLESNSSAIPGKEPKRRSENQTLPRHQGAKAVGKSAYITKMEAEMEDFEEHICLSDQSASSNLPCTFQDQSENRALPRRQGAKAVGKSAYITKMEAEMEDFEEHICLSDHSASRSLPSTFQGQSENQTLPRGQGAKSMGRPAYITKMEAQMEDFEEHICLSDQSASRSLPSTFQGQSENRTLPRGQGAKSMGRPAYITKMEAQMEDFEDRTCLSDQSASSNVPSTFEDQSENRALPRRQGAKSMGRSAYITKMETQMGSKDFQDRTCLSDQSASGNLPCTFQDQSEKRALPRGQGAKVVGRSAYITKMEAQMGSKDFQDRIRAIDQIVESCCLNPAMVTACIFPVFDNIRGRLVESNRIVNLHMLKALDAIIPQVKESLPKVANIVIPAIVDNHLNSRNPAIFSAALAAIHALVQNLDNAIMVEILATKAQLIGGQAKLDLTYTVADMVEEVYSRKPKMVEKEVLPLLWHMLAVSSNSTATGALLSALHSQMGTKLRAHAASQPFTITKCLDHFLNTV